MFNGKSILVTGGTGSFGKRFIRRVLAESSPERVIVYSRDELKQYELSQLFPEAEFPSLRYFLGDVRDRNRLARALTGVDIVIHAAALKHVTAAEYNPFEFVKTNVMGAENLIDTCIDAGVEKVVALSTDKASNPINLYGATKLCSDKLFVAGNSYAGRSKTRFSVVRYGNVMGSRGSVIPFFLSCRSKGVLPITDDRMTRFWITLDQGIELVMAALEQMQGGEIFVPKIPSMKVVDLAAALAPECRLEMIGIRPGEKLHECMITEDDAPHTLEHPGHYVVLPAIHNWYLDPKRHQGGKPVPPGFRYSSELNTQWLSGDELMQILSGYELRGAELVRKDEAVPSRRELPAEMN
ncbi:MAG TPA: UDP-N-acetylglucosamine 4,6-dehydratase (inverting) [Thermoanaerobaculia bacterium]|nr:UDP-N-acetylglucosamine 4,6-dehydratase (inverting) [Thermoanaerobaculia bacterium]